jgi:hypothetical protein
LNKVAAKFLVSQPKVVFVPIVQAIIAIFWVCMWAFFVSFILSQVTEDYVPTEHYDDYAKAYGTVETPGTCTDQWPVGSVWKYEGDLEKTDDPCSGNKGDTSGITPACWRCAPPRYMIHPQFFYAGFTFLWANAFNIAIGQTVIAGAVGVWFFAPNGTKDQCKSVGTSLRNVFRYHTGSLALGSFIIALVQFIRYCLKYFEQQAKAQKNRVMALVLKVVGYCLWCFEKCLKFLTKNAYIQIALVGKNFCTSAKKAFFLITRNAVRFAVFATLGGVVNLLGIALIMAATLFMGYFILMAMHPETNPVAPMIVFGLMSYVVAKLFMNVFMMACDSMMQCFIITEELKLEESKQFVPDGLRHLIRDKE